MGNAFCGKRSTKVMKISGETFKLKAPARAGPLLREHPGHVLLESEAVRHYGVRAKPLEPHQELKPSRLYFLVQLPQGRGPPRRLRSAGEPTSAKDRLESLMLARRSASDLSAVRLGSVESAPENAEGGGGGVRVRIRLPKAEVERLVEGSNCAAEVAEKIVGLWAASGGGGVAERNRRCGYDGGDVRGQKVRQKRVGFSSIREAEIPIVVAS
ncbi:Encodes a protein whose expression is responsive to nematode infection [Striga hermonthica]|uniref:Encodes a protein whose expression is responsive to nematode infection n=1 Tax=Striga hermonthica TaxID=68872 RepID=A0A9N7NEN5_STRHE|nr:Encodes a protein whose expression is responsive to nematode infection [Striga hermonthica]